jgi:hypothetical protein
MSPKNDASLQTTKQMLDELDALMERMLSVPVNDSEDAPLFPAEVVNSPALSAKLTLLESAPLSQIPAPPMLEQHPPFNPPHRTMPAQPAAAEPVEMAEPQRIEPELLTNDVLPPSIPSPVGSLLAEVSAPDDAQLGELGFAPALWVNQAFDASTEILGGAGGLLRGPAARTLLGIAGVALLLVAIGWFLNDWLGWNGSVWFNKIL